MNDNELFARVEALEQAMADLHSGNTIPLWLDQALTGRGFLKSTSGGTGSFGTQNIPVTGGIVQNIPAQPSGTVSLTIRGVVYNLLYS